MRLHHLRVTAFGPFAETVEVDFDALGDAGLFLLGGATGAGKTSILDAVCFGLYGEVPGDRHAARHLRSDHAAPQVAAEVVLALSVSGQTFQFTRSPAWERPRKRGTGTTKQPARVVVEERVGDGWQGLTTRLDDAGLLVTDLLGMTCTQFTQVVMLPQGRFQAFLRASSAERQHVLQRLFRTDRFERVEQWLVDRRVTLRRESQVAESRVAGLLHRIQEATDTALPDWDLDDLARPANDGALVDWVSALADATSAEAASAATDAEAASARVTVAADQAARAQRLADLQRRGRRAQDTLDQLEAGRGEADLLVAAVDAHRRAAPVLRSVERASSAADAFHRHSTAAAQALARRQLPADASADQVEALRLDAVRAHAAVEAARPRAEALTRARGELSTARRRVAEADAALNEVRMQAETAPAVKASLRAELDEARSAAARLPDLRTRVDGLRRSHAAAVAQVEVAAQLTEARELLQSVVDRAQELREVHLVAREARIQALAGELAGQLVSGCACPVCGSAEHPAPRLAATGGEREHEDVSLRAYEDAEAVRLAQAEVVASLAAKVRALAEACDGATDAQWAARLRTAQADLDATGSAAGQLTGLAAAWEQLESELTGHDEQMTAATAALAAATADLDRARELASALEAELALTIGDFPSLEQAIQEHAGRADRLGEVVALLVRRDEAARACADAESAAAEAAREARFGGPVEVLAAVLEPSALAAADQLLTSRTRSLTAAGATLADDEIRMALAQPQPDLAALAASLVTATAHHQERAVVLARLRSRVERLDGLGAELEGELAAWAPVRDTLDTVGHLASFVEGKSTDNALRMRLSAYVLGERLRQVVAAANARLSQMTSQRYSLEHTDERGVGAQRGGLSLLVRDDWSGVLRDPATLSGGETFVVSLALALGLADTVAQEAGGAQIDTLFVDEGFGSLDADTLEDVMDVLDGLREGGRVVGVVSHVAEMRDRITTRLEVRKGRRGSHVVVP